jgi:probable phosphoglycerate mutase
VSAAPDELARADVVLVRHGGTTYNAEHRLNGDPRIPVHLSETGRAQCEALQPLLGQIAWQAVYVTRFSRTIESLALMLPRHPEPVVLADLDDIDVGAFEGDTVEAYRAWRHEHGVADKPGGGESRVDVLVRYARGLAWLAREAPSPSLCVTHDQPIRYVENALAGDHPILGRHEGVPNATPFPYERARLAEGARLMEAAVADSIAADPITWP